MIENDIKNILGNEYLSIMEKMLIIQTHKEDFGYIDYLAAMTVLSSNSHYCAACGVYYDINKCETYSITKELTCEPSKNESLFDLLIEGKPLKKTVTITAVKCPLGHKAIIDHKEV